MPIYAPNYFKFHPQQVLLYTRKRSTCLEGAFGRLWGCLWVCLSGVRNGNQTGWPLGHGRVTKMAPRMGVQTSTSLECLTPTSLAPNAGQPTARHCHIGRTTGAPGVAKRSQNNTSNKYLFGAPKKEQAGSQREPNQNRTESRRNQTRNERKPKRSEANPNGAKGKPKQNRKESKGV